MKDLFKVNYKQRIVIPKKGEYFKFKNYEKKINSPFMIYTDFESILSHKVHVVFHSLKNNYSRVKSENKFHIK